MGGHEQMIGSSRRDWLLQILAGSPMVASSASVYQLLADVSSRYKALNEFVVKAEVSASFNGGSIASSTTPRTHRIVILARGPEMRYELHIPSLGMLVCWTDRNYVREYEDAGNRYFETLISTETGRLVVLPIITTAQRKFVSRFVSLDQAEPTNQQVKAGSVSIRGDKVPCRRVSVVAPRLLAEHGTEELWISERTGFVVRSDIREIHRGTTIVGETRTVWTEVSDHMPSNLEIPFPIPKDAKPSPTVLMVGKK